MARGGRRRREEGEAGAEAEQQLKAEPTMLGTELGGGVRRVEPGGAGAKRKKTVDLDRAMRGEEEMGVLTDGSHMMVVNGMMTEMIPSLQQNKNGSLSSLQPNT